MGSQASLQYALARKEIGARAARTSFKHFVSYTFPDYEWNWHNKMLIWYLQEFIEFRIKKLMVFMPPRHGKSELVSRRLPAFLLGQDPDMEVVVASYGMDLAARMNRDTQRIMQSLEYQDVFPRTKLSTGKRDENKDGRNYLKNSEIIEIVGHFGKYQSCGVGSSLTGKGFDVGIIDDPVKDMKEACSPTIQMSTWEWYESVFSTRGSKAPRELITQTRWHEDDLSGKLLKEIKKSDNEEGWVILRLPAIKEKGGHQKDPRQEGEALWPDRYSKTRLEKAKRSPRIWISLFQQRPTPLEGAIWKRANWRFYDEDPKDLIKTMTTVIQSWDATFKGNENSDYVVGHVWGRYLNRLFLFDEARGQWDFTQTLSNILRVSTLWPEAQIKLIEDAANGPAIENMLRSKVDDLELVPPIGSKTERAMVCQPSIDAGEVFIPNPEGPYAWKTREDTGEQYNWVEEFIEECNVFPKGVNDDRVDAGSQAMIRLLEDSPVPSILNF